MFFTGVSFDIKKNVVFFTILYVQVSKLQGDIATYNQLSKTIVLHLSVPPSLISISIEFIFFS